MSDRFAAELRIGGKLNEKQVQDLIDALHEDECILYPNWDGPAFEPKNKQDIVNALSDMPKECLIFCNSKIRNGEFESTETALREAGIPYERWSDGYCEYDSEIVWWHPGIDSQQSTIVNGQGDPVCRQVPVEQALGQLEKWHKLGHDPDGQPSNTMITQAIELLQKVVVKVPELPKMEFV